jgi:precorrin-3B methylase
MTSEGKSSRPRGGLRVRDLPQLNIRISQQVAQVLEAAAFVHGYKGYQELIEPVVAARAAELGADEAVKAAMAAKQLKLAQGREA